MEKIFFCHYLSYQSSILKFSASSRLQNRSALLGYSLASTTPAKVNLVSRFHDYKKLSNKSKIFVGLPHFSAKWLRNMIARWRCKSQYKRKGREFSSFFLATGCLRDRTCLVPHWRNFSIFSKPHIASNTTQKVDIIRCSRCTWLHTDITN